MNINSVRNKFDLLVSRITDDLGVLLSCETKIGDSFPTGNFLMNDFSKSYRLDRFLNGGEIYLYARDDIL